MRRIELTWDIHALIDDEDYLLVSQYKWCASRMGPNWYAVTSVWNSILKKRHMFMMHRLIMNASPGQEIDHKEHYEDHIDNRRSNLRFCTSAENNRNQRKQLSYAGKPTSSQYKGVWWDRGKWIASIRVNRKSVYLGRFDNEIEAARAYNKAAIEHFGEFAKLNRIEEVHDAQGR